MLTEATMKGYKLFLVFTNTLSLGLSIAMIVMGHQICTRYQPYAHFYGSLPNGGVAAVPLTVFVMGFPFLLAALLGYYAVYKQCTGWLQFYGFLLVFLVIPMLVTMILSFTVTTYTVQNYVNIPIAQYVTDYRIERQIDLLQESLDCCGKESYLDYEGLVFRYRNYAIFRGPNGQKVTVPRSCCKARELIDIDTQECPRVYQRVLGCKFGLASFHTTNSLVLNILGPISITMQIACIIFAFMLVRNIRQVKKHKTTSETVIATCQNQAGLPPIYEYAPASNFEYGIAPPPYSR